MSVANLKQVTPTRGLTCSVSDFHRLFESVAFDVAEERDFNLYR